MLQDEIYKIYGTNYKKMTLDILDKADLREEIERKAKNLGVEDAKTLKIGLKPNLVCASPSNFGATTHTEVMAGIIEYLQQRDFNNIVIAEGSWVGDRTSDAYEYCGYRTLCETYDVPFVDAQKDGHHTVNCAGLDIEICDVYDDIDFLVNVPVMKGHCQTRMTCALKNMKGLIPNTEKRHFHSMGLHKPIAHLSQGIHQDFIVIDHICGDLDFEEGGNPITRNCVMAALDPVLVDAYVCKLMGIRTSDVPYIKMAEKIGSGSANVEDARIYDLNEGNMDNEPPRERKVLRVKYAVDEVDSCSACYANLVPALLRLKDEGLLDKLDTQIAIGQGHQGESGKVGVGKCTKDYEFCVMGCPPDTEKIYTELKDYIQKL
ncbi:MAG: DUF362 domain-containing protein [Lachnospiraceae bacterium]|nr:DUF362 domain-containing protein [Lachnospiraceae bacterium]